MHGVEKLRCVCGCADHEGDAHLLVASGLRGHGGADAEEAGAAAEPGGVLVEQPEHAVLGDRVDIGVDEGGPGGDTHVGSELGLLKR